MKMKTRLKAIIQLIITTIVGVWAVHRLAADAMNPIEGGWHTTIHTSQFQKMKLIGVTITLAFFIIIWFRMLKKVIYQKGK